MRSWRAISPRTHLMVRCANAASVCHSVSSDSAPSTSPCQRNNCPDGAVARTAAISSGNPAAAAKIRMARRRVLPSFSPTTVEEEEAAKPNISDVAAAMEADRIFGPSRIFHRPGNRNAQPRLVATFRGLHERWTALVVVIFDLAIQAL